MPGWGWALLAIAVIVVLAVIAWQVAASRRRSHLRQQFGPEYDRTLESSDSTRQAEAELAAREERRRELDIRPLTSAARQRYLRAWEATQAQFVDDPAAAVDGADSLIRSVMSERGYPVSDFEQRAADLSVDHPDVVENYREGTRYTQAARNGDDATENLRRAMRSYRLLFESLVEGTADEPIGRERAVGDDGTAPQQVESDRGAARPLR